MKTSVVMATYNGEKYLEQQLDSILTQSVLPDELIVVDDGSTDNTRRILTEFSLKNREKIAINLIFRENNIGYIGNFIDGIGRATNDLIFLCDQDDLWHKEKIKNSINYFTINPQIVALHTNTSIINNKNELVRKGSQEYTKTLEKVSLAKFIKKVNYPGMAMVFRKNKLYSRLSELYKITKLPTHDWVIGFLACLLDGFYTSCDIYTYRRDTGENVALNLEKNRISSIERRIEGIELYSLYYNFLKECQDDFGFSILNLKVDKYLNNARNRIAYLREKNLVHAIMNINNLSYYPSLMAYFGDILLLIKAG
ncbi:Glycosyl transferase family 2 [Streptococcus henryi]|uniref:Glycosyl transferase family 2 n=1 Tax=Streptococcus henryi TaxID=439219 RepID=A0A1G6D9T9_9STRE|nr:glycosyltransferase [Streptococcus henryi]SDB41954.1 Glycosyl transferase family 2 [Streptococcus henryi]